MGYRHFTKKQHYMIEELEEVMRTVRRFIIYWQYNPEQICGRFRLKELDSVFFFARSYLGAGYKRENE